MQHVCHAFELHRSDLLLLPWDNQQPFIKACSHLCSTSDAHHHIEDTWDIGLWYAFTKLLVTCLDGSISAPVLQLRCLVQ